MWNRPCSLLEAKQVGVLVQLKGNGEPNGRLTNDRHICNTPVAGGVWAEGELKQM